MGLVAALEARVGCHLPGSQALANDVRHIRLGRGETLITAGTLDRGVSFVSKGLFKLVYLRPDGTERIRDFVTEGSVVASIETLEANEPAPYSVIAYEEAEVERISYDKLVPLFQSNLAWARCQALFFYDTALHRGQRERSLLTLTPPERFHAVANERADVLRRVSQQDLAAFIGVTPVSLSRLKSRLRRDG